MDKIQDELARLVTDLTPEQYAAENGKRCPRCKSTDLYSGADLQLTVSGAGTRARCASCGARWEDHYRLVGYAELEAGDPAESEINLAL